MRVTIDTKLNDPLTDGRLAQAVERAAEEVRTEVGDLAYTEVKQNLQRSLRNPTGFYQSRVVRKVMFDSVVVNDSGVVYGPWLEGTGSRNRSTRFKGYKSFRQARQQVEQRGGRLAERIVMREVGRL